MLSEPKYPRRQNTRRSGLDDILVHSPSSITKDDIFEVIWRFANVSYFDEAEPDQIRKGVHCPLFRFAMVSEIFLENGAEGKRLHGIRDDPIENSLSDDVNIMGAVDISR